MRFIASLFAGACLLLVSSIGFAQVDQAIYTDSLVNGWENWSWATVNFANRTPVHAGTSSCSVTITAWNRRSTSITPRSTPTAMRT